MELIRLSEGSITIVDTSHMLPELKRIPGVTSWRIMNKEGTWFDNYESVPIYERKKLLKSMFPPTPEEAEKANLKRCMRLLPHHQDTGAFFIAVLEKNEKFPHLERNKRKPKSTTPTTTSTSTSTSVESIESTSSPTPSASTSSQPSNAAEDLSIKSENQEVIEDGEDEILVEEKEVKVPGGKRNQRTWVEEPFLPLPEELKPTIASLVDYYGIIDFPLDQVFTRSSKNQKLYFASKSIANLLAGTNGGPLVVINTGLKVFNLHELSEFGYRICQDAIQYFLPLITKRKVSITHAELNLLLEANINPDKLNEGTTKQINDLGTGCVVLVVNEPNTPSTGMGFVCWFGKSTINLLLKSSERKSLKNLFSPEIKKEGAEEEPAVKNENESGEEENDDNNNNAESNKKRKVDKETTEDTPMSTQ